MALPTICYFENMRNLELIDSNSLEAFNEIKPKLSNRPRLVFQALRNKPASNNTLAKRMQIPINQVTPRVLELRKKGLVKKVYSEIENGRTVNVWGVSL